MVADLSRLTRGGALGRALALRKTAGFTAVDKAVGKAAIWGASRPVVWGGKAAISHPGAALGIGLTTKPAASAMGQKGKNYRAGFRAALGEAPKETA